jgi:hypothetical protein
MSTDDALPWTTSRCNRLLRPLSSKLAKLRKELERPRSSGRESRNVSSAFATKGSPVKTTNFTRPAHKPRGFDKARDPDWRPGAKPGASKKTYGGRGGKKIAGLQRSNSDESNVSRPGEIAFTPLIARMGGQLHSSPQVQLSPLKRFGKNRGPLLANVEQFQARHMPADLHKLVQGLSEAYANLLQATTAGDERRWKGTRSLMGACLRKIPAYIELEEHFAELDRLEEEEETDDRDVGHEIYEHLEARFEQRTGQGWRPFRQVVRAHGSSLLCHAITDEVLGLQCVSVLVTHCLNVSAWDEAERLLLAYVPLLEPLSIPINIKADLFDLQRQPYLSMVKGFVDRTGRHSLLYDLLEHMIALELLPLEWLATECMRPIWDRLVRTISDNHHRTLANASRFLETATIASMGLPDRRLLEDEVTGSVARRFVPSSRDELRIALNTTFSSLLTVLCSIALVHNSRDDAAGHSDSESILWVLDANVVALSQRDDIQDEMKLLDPDTEDAQVFAQRALWVHFASFLVHLEKCNKNETLIDIDIATSISLINQTLDAYLFKTVNVASILATIPSLVSATARGTGRIWKDDGFDQLQRLVSTLTTTSGCRLPHKLWTLKRLALEATMEFAHNTGDAEHMAYAREIENKMRIQGKLIIVQSPAKNDSPTNSGGFRWEEGIGEWVTCTPFAKQAIKRQARRPVRALELLPTPAQSDDEKADMRNTSESDNELPENSSNLMWDSDDEGMVPQSSPLKKIRVTSTSSLGKRARASSPRIVIPAKRLQLAQPDTPVIAFYPTLPEDKHTHSEPRRSVRARQDRKELTSRLRTQRSRTSLEGGLRNVNRPSYAEPVLESENDSDASTTASEVDDSSLSVVSTHRTSTAPPRSSRNKARSSSSSSIYRQPEVQHDNISDYDNDELGKTPGRPRAIQKRKSGQVIAGRKKQWWKFTAGAAVDDSEASEDELSFH